MILVDTSVWIDHLRERDRNLETLLEDAQVLTHPFILGELAMGTLKQRDVVMRALHRLTQAKVARDQEVLEFISLRRLFGRGLGYLDAHLLASARLTPTTLLWSRDKRLVELATELSLAFQPATH